LDLHRRRLELEKDSLIWRLGSEEEEQEERKDLGSLPLEERIPGFQVDRVM